MPSRLSAVADSPAGFALKPLAAREDGELTEEELKGRQTFLKSFLNYSKANPIGEERRGLETWISPHTLNK